MYVVTRQEPHRYDAGAAASAGGFLLIWGLVISFLVVIVVGLIQGAGA